MTELNNTQDEMLLDETLDDLADAPSQALWPAGAYAASIRITRSEKKVGSYVVGLECQQPIELSNPNDTEPAPGDRTVAFIHTRKKDGSANEIGQGQLKNVLKPIAAAMETNSISEVLEATKDGLDVIVVVKVRKSKDPAYDDSQEIVKLEMPQ